MNIKKQISRLYLYEVISGLQIVDTVWVFFLLVCPAKLDHTSRCKSGHSNRQ